MTIMRLGAFLVGAGFILGACASGSPGSGGTGNAAPGGGAMCMGSAVIVSGTASVSLNDACGDPASSKGTEMPGGPCKTSADCVPTCCACSGKAKSALAAACDMGKCPTADAVCCTFTASLECKP